MATGGPVARSDGELPTFRLEALLAAYPGPAIVVAADHTVVAANRPGQAVLAARNGVAWWRRVVEWLVTEANPAQHPLLVPVEVGRTQIALEWLPCPLDGGLALLLARDVTLERQLRLTLIESRQRFKDLVAISSDFAWETDAGGRFVFVSPRGALGYSAEALVGRHPAELVAEYDPDLPLPFTTEREVAGVELWMMNASGEPVCLTVAALPLLAPDGAVIGARGVCRDITEEVQKSHELARIRTGELVLGHIAHALRDSVDAEEAITTAAREITVALGADGCRVWRRSGGESDASLALAVTIGEPPAGLENVLERVVASGDPVTVVQGSVRCLGCRSQYRHTVNGALCLWRWDTGRAWLPDDLALVAGVAGSIGLAHAHAAYQERLRRLSERDGLTGLLNRRTFLERLNQRLERGDAGESALLYLDLDNFKAVNDVFGHHRGDAVLKEITRLLTAVSGPDDLVGRIGGDELVIWLAKGDATKARATAQRLLDGIGLLRHLSASAALPLGFSIGIALHHSGTPATAQGLPATAQGLPATAQGLIDRADAAMYLAKKHGKGGYRLAPEPATSAAGG